MKWRRWNTVAVQTNGSDTLDNLSLSLCKMSLHQPALDVCGYTSWVKDPLSRSSFVLFAWLTASAVNWNECSEYWIATNNWTYCPCAEDTPFGVVYHPPGEGFRDYNDCNGCWCSLDGTAICLSPFLQLYSIWLSNRYSDVLSSFSSDFTDSGDHRCHNYCDLCRCCNLREQEKRTTKEEELICTFPLNWLKPCFFGTEISIGTAAEMLEPVTTMFECSGLSQPTILTRWHLQLAPGIFDCPSLFTRQLGNLGNWGILFLGIQSRHCSVCCLSQHRWRCLLNLQL